MRKSLQKGGRSGFLPLVFSLKFLLLILSSPAQNGSLTGDEWLETNAGSAQALVNGTWRPLQAGWGGAAHLVQVGNVITGSLGRFRVRGSINESRVYLIFSLGSKDSLSAVLTQRGKYLSGVFSDSVPFNSGRQGLLVLERREN